MAKATIKVKMEYAKYRIIFFPVATFSRIGDLARLTVFGLPVYQASGKCRKFLWHSYLKG